MNVCVCVFVEARVTRSNTKRMNVNQNGAKDGVGREERGDGGGSGQ